MKLPRLRGTVAARILVSLAGVSSVGIILAVASVSLQSARVLRATIADRNLEIARQSAREISRYITESIDELSALNALVAAFPRNTFVQRTVLSDMTLEFPKYRRLAVVGPDGSILADSRLAAASLDLLEAASVRPLLSDRVVASTVKVAADFTPYMLVASPMRLADNSSEWLVGALYLRDIWGLVDQISVGNAGAAYLISDARNVDRSPDKTQVLSSSQVAAPPGELFRRRGWSARSGAGQPYVPHRLRADTGPAGWAVAVQQP